MKKPWNIPPGSQGCAGAGRFYNRRRPRRGGGQLLLACVTLLNVALSLAMAVFNRQEAIHALRGQGAGETQVLLTAKKETKTPRL